MTASAETDVERPSDRRRRAKLKSIVDAASLLFARDGYEETSLADVATAVDLTPKAIYYYFDSKRALLDSVIGQGFHYFDPDALAATRPKWVGLPLEQALLESSIEAAADLAGHGDLLRVSFSESFRGNEDTSARHEAYMTDWVDHVVLVIRDAKWPTKLTDKRARPLAVQTVDALFGVCVDGVLRRRPELVNDEGVVDPDRSFFEALTRSLVRGTLG